MKIILASASPRRKELIQNIFNEITVIPANVDEAISDNMPPEEVPIYLAEKKALCLAEHHKSDLIIAADTVVILENEILGKPKNVADAKRMLRSLSGNVHDVITGCSLALGDRLHSFSVKSQVHFYPISDQEIEWYISTNEPMDKAGSYGVQGKGGLFVKEIHGDYYNIVGLPIARLRRELQKFIPNDIDNQK